MNSKTVQKLEEARFQIELQENIVWQRGHVFSKRFRNRKASMEKRIKGKLK